jgi:hypothetical protein
MEDVASGAHAAIVELDEATEVLQPAGHHVRR